MKNQKSSFVPKIFSRAENHPLATIGVFVIFLLGPFLNKAVHIDDSLFVWTAEHILKHPVDFYGFDVNWFGYVMPMAVANCNPPTTSYLLAWVMTVFGEKEIFLHAAVLLVTFAAAAGTFELAKIWCARPLTATLIALSTPVFLVSATTLMCDVPMLAAWIWAVVLWERALKTGSAPTYFFAALLAGLSVLTKYSALTLMPLLPILGLLRKRNLGWWLLWLAVPTVMIEAYQFGTAKLYGHGLISAAANYASQTRFKGTGGWANKIIIGFAYGGGCLLPVLLFIFRLWTKRQLILGGGIVLTMAAAIIFATGIGQSFGWLFQLQMILMLAGGIHLALLALTELWRQRDVISLMIVLWLGSGFFFAAVLNWTVSARSFLPLAPVAAILAVRTLTRTASEAKAQTVFTWPLAISFCVSLMIAAADFSLANSGREAALELAEKFASSQGRLWFQGHCGFQFYLQRFGAQPVDFSQSVLLPGELLIVPSNNSNLIPPATNDVEVVADPKYSVCSWLSTVNGKIGAGFYGAGGLLPFVFGPVPAETYSAYQVLQTMKPPYFVWRAMQTTLIPPEVMNNLAWRLATSPDPKIRDGNQAVQLAERACQLTDYRETIVVGTLGAAYAEVGRFDAAIATAQKACDLAEKSGETNLLQKNQELLELYRQHKPYHETTEH